MVHGDDAGLKLPPLVAPIQVTVVPIWRTADELAAVEGAVARILEAAIPLAELAPRVETLLADIQAALLRSARRMLDEHIAAVETSTEVAERVGVNAGWSLAHWYGDPACEARVKTETKATIRCIPRDLAPEPGRCIVCGGVSERRVIFARAY